MGNTTKRDYYEVLGVSKSASTDELKRAFRKLSMQYHPDRQHGKTDVEKTEAENKFKEAAEAYEVLSDKTKRQQYDQFGFAGPSMASSNFSDFDMSDFMSRHSGMFSNFFGGNNPFEQFSGFSNARSSSRYKQFDPNSPEDGNDLQTTLEISFKESITGCDAKEFTITGSKACSTCNGTGIKSGTTVKECQHCNGTGVLTTQQRTPFGMTISQTICPSCHGTGGQFEVCPICSGKKRVSDKKHISLKIPAGISNGQRLRLVGKGVCGVCGGRDGNLYITVNVKPSDVFTRNGNDILITAYVSAVTASIGGKITIPTLTGYKEIKINPGTCSDTIQRVSKAGVNGGDLIIKIIVEPLSNLTNEQQKLLEQLNSTLTSKNNRREELLKQRADNFYKN